MAAIGFKSAKCKDCYKCVRICPVKAIHTDAEHVRYVADECIPVSYTHLSQLKNKDKGLKVLRSRLYDLELEKKQKEEAANRKNQVGTGDRSEKIRTYNFPQGRCTDHRIKLTLHRLDDILNGDLDEVLDSLTAVSYTHLDVYKRQI